MPKPQYGTEHNQQRRVRGIPLVPNNWYTYSVLYDSTAWVNPIFNRGQWDKHSGIRACKDVYYDKDQILKEQDSYYSGRTFQDPDAGALDEEMTIAYSYSAERAGKPAWACRIMEGPLDGEHALEDAQAILRKWGIPEEELPGTKKAP
jgi:hypothetical protein